MKIEKLGLRNLPMEDKNLENNYEILTVISILNNIWGFHFHAKNFGFKILVNLIENIEK